MELIKKEWESFQRVALNDYGITAFQREQMRKAFFSGAFAILPVLMDHANPYRFETLGEAERSGAMCYGARFVAGHEVWRTVSSTKRGAA